jgi:predicted esterase
MALRFHNARILKNPHPACQVFSISGRRIVRLSKTLLRLAALAWALAPSAPAQTVPAPPADLKVQDLRAGGDDKKRFFLIHRPVEPPKAGWRTLFVLPGGSGDAQFHPFVANIARNALPESYLVVQLVAPVWNPEQARNLVWPGAKSAVPGMKFTTAEFFLAVRADVAKTHKLDPRYSFSLTWSSSGMSGYQLSLLPKSGITGTFVAMSVFNPTLLPPLTAAKNHPYFIYHSPEDFIPIAQPEAAREALRKAGAIVEFQTYSGGHGWHGTVFEDIRKGILWLEQHTTATGKPPPTPASTPRPAPIGR